MRHEPLMINPQRSRPANSPQIRLDRGVAARSRVAVALGCLIACACAAENGQAGPLLPYVPAVGNGPACIPNLDGHIDASELVAAMGIPARFRVSPAELHVPVDLKGFVNDKGQQVWDWSERSSTDRLASFTATPVSGRWYAAHFAADAFTVGLDAGGRFDAVYRRDVQGLWLLGTASREESPADGQSLLVYQQPVAVLRFPLEKGRSWTSKGKVSNGKLYGLPWIGEDTYEVSVDATGRLELPDLTLTQTLRVRTKLTITPAIGPTITEQQVSFLFECLGEVARATSLRNETKADFETASELRRLSL